MNSRSSNLAAWVIPPAMIAGSVALHLAIVRHGWSHFPATYIPIILAAAVVTVLERIFPYRREWKPDRRDIRTDLSYMIVVQLAFPKLLAFTIAALALTRAETLELPISLASRVQQVVVAKSMLRMHEYRVVEANS